MNNFDNYLFIYKDSVNNWNECTNPTFIAMHRCCRAIKKSECKNIKYLCKKLSSPFYNCVTKHLIKKHNIY